MPRDGRRAGPHRRADLTGASSGKPAHFSIGQDFASRNAADKAIDGVRGNRHRGPLSGSGQRAAASIRERELAAGPWLTTDNR